jgi:tight adherence protein B
MDIERTLSVIVFALLMATAIFLYRGKVLAVTQKDRRVSHRLGLDNSSNFVRVRTSESKNDAVAFTDRNFLARMLEAMIDQAGVTLSPAALAITITVSFIVGTALSIAYLNFGGALMVGLVFGAAPVVYLRVLRRSRLRQFGQQLPYVLDLLRSALEAGHTLLRALQLASENTPDPMGAELHRTVEQVQVGISLPEALEGIYKRIPEEELGFLAIAVRIQAQVGSSLAEILRHVASGVRTRQRLQQQVKVLTAQSRASAIIVTLLPFIVLGVFGMIRPGYAAPLFHDPTGVKLLETAVALDVMAFIVMRKIGRVDY